MSCGSYRIDYYEGYLEIFVRLEEGYQERIVGLLRHVQTSPTGRYPGLKRLRGVHSHIWEFMVSRARGAIRLNYTIDEDECVVRIEYLGPHPDYSYSRRSSY